MNAAVKYITAAFFLIILEMLIINEMWLLAIIFGIITIVYLLLEFRALRSKFFYSTTGILLIVSYLVFRLQFGDLESLHCYLISITYWPGLILEQYVSLGLGILTNFI